MKTFKRKWGCYEDYAQELDNEGRERRHDAGECDGVPLCAICVMDAGEAFCTCGCIASRHEFEGCRDCKCSSFEDQDEAERPKTWKRECR